MRSEINRLDPWQFRTILALIVWLPLPLASNRTWAIAILVTVVAILFFTCLYSWRNHVQDVIQHLRQFRLPVFLFVAYLSIAALQVLPLPDFLVSLLSPEAFRVQVEAGLQSQMHLSLDIYQSRLMLGLTTSYFIVFVLILILVRDRQRLDVLVRTFVLSGVLQALLGIVLFSMNARYQLFHVEIKHENVIGSFVNRNHFAGYMEMTLALGIGLMIARLAESSPSHRGIKQKIVAGLRFMMSPKMRLRLLLVMMVIALVLTRSRMGNTAFFSSLLVVGSLTIIFSRKHAPATAALILSLVIVDVVVIGTWVGLEKVVTRINNTNVEISANQSEESIEQRTLPAVYAMKLIRDFPLVGTGAGSFYISFSRYRPPEVTGYFDHAHNDYVEIATDMGIVALLSLGGLVIAALYQSLQTLRKRRSSLPRGIAFGVAMSIVSIGIHSAVDFNLQIPANALSFVIVLALAWVCAKLPSRNKSI